MATNSSAVEQGFPRPKRARTHTSEVLVRAKDPENTAEEHFERSLLLCSDYFKDGLERWKPETGIPSFELLLPEGASASRGLALLMQRLVENSDENNEVLPWNCPKWWRVADGDTTSLLTALYIFDHIVAKSYRDEVAETIETFRVPCVEPYLSILRQALPPQELSHQESRFPPFKADTKTLKSLVDSAMTGTDNARALADRAIASCTAEALVPVIWARFRTVDWDDRENIFALNWIYFHVEKIGARSQDACRIWLSFVLQDMQSRPQVSTMEVWGAMIATARIAIDALLHGFLLETCRNKVVPEEAKTSLSECISDITEQVEEIRSLIPKVFRPGLRCWWNEDLLEVAPPFVQLSILEAVRSCWESRSKKITPLLLSPFLGRVSIVAPESRHVLLRMLNILKEDDVVFLHSASFPALEASASQPRRS